MTGEKCSAGAKKGEVRVFDLRDPLRTEED